LDALTVATNFVDVAMMKLQSTIAKGIGAVARVFSGTDTGATAAEARIARISPELEKLKKQADDVRDSISMIGATDSVKFAAIGDEIAKINREIDQSNKSVDAEKNAERGVRIAELQKTQAEQAYAAFKSMDEAMGAVAKTEADYAMSLLSETEQQTKNNAAIKEKERALLSLKSALGDKINSFDITTASPRDIQMMDELKMKLGEYNELLGKRKVMETDLQIIARNAGNILASGFEDAIFSGQKLGEVIRSLGMDLMRMVFQQTVTAPLAAGISGAILKGFGARAMGGPVNSGSPYVVGEKGPELFVPHSSGSIVPNGAMGSSGGSTGGVNVTYNIAAGVSRAELVPILEQERRRLKAEIPDMVRRGGSYRSAFA
jgi:Rps23 Pro-64 3,4-dihydroxylase Tpa1-like proline 4-hydroxylase